MTALEITGAVILGAGQSKRFGPENKLLQTIDDKPIVRWTAECAVNAGVADIVIVTGHDAPHVVNLLSDLPVRCVNNATPWTGMGASLALGINALSPSMEAAFVMLADMPTIASDTLREMSDTLDRNKTYDIAVPVHDGRRGHPVLFTSRYFPQLSALDGDQGARQLLRENPDRIKAVPVSDPGTRRDIDTLEDYAELLGIEDVAQ